MNDAAPYLKLYDAKDYPKLASFNRKEILRYAGVKLNFDGKNSATKELNDAETACDEKVFCDICEECILEAIPVLSYKVSYRGYDLIWENEGDSKIPLLPFDRHESNAIILNLSGCDRVTLFAATIGIGIDRLIAKYSRVSPTKALFMQAIGAERIEALCDTFCEEMGLTHPRFSPGYGDLPLDVQKELFALLDCERRLGLTLNDSLLMSPSKSVTAIAGSKNGNCFLDTNIGSDISNDSDADININAAANTGTSNHKCDSCEKTDCEFRMTN